MLSIEEGSVLVKTARSAVESYLTGETFQPPNCLAPTLSEKRGVFVTLLNHLESNGLRGCIGNPHPTHPLLEQAATSAVEAATMDPRFEPVTLGELHSGIVLEVSVLSHLQTVPVKNPLELRDKIVIGRDGLLAEGEGLRGLLLPQVAVTEGFDSEEFLCQCCLKAGLPPDAWISGSVQVFRFQSQVFAEDRPEGRVFERHLDPRNLRSV